MKNIRLALSTLSILFLLSCRLLTRAGETDTAVPTRTTVIPTAQDSEPVQPVEAPVVENEHGNSARAHLEALTNIGARPPGSENERLAAEYINGALLDLGYEPELQEFTVRDGIFEEFSSQNVIAVKPGESPKEIIIGAHYDSGDEGTGADDNASGVAVMLETAELVANLQTPYSIRFIAFGSEENGLDGSYYYAAQMDEGDVENTLAMVNLDSLAAGDITYVYSDEGEDAFLRDWVLEWADGQGYPLQTILDAELSDGDSYYSDFGAFKDRGIPFIYFEATNWTLGEMDGWTQVDPRYGRHGYIWHTPFDNLEYLDATFPGRVNEHLNIFVSALFAVTTEFNE